MYRIFTSDAVQQLQSYSSYPR